MSKILEQQYEIVSIDAIKPHPQNARCGNTAGICESISENGFFGAVYVQRSSGFILAGKHRWDSAKREGLRDIPVIWIEASDTAARKILAADNALADQAKYSDHALAELLTEIYSESGLRGSGYDQASYDALITQLGNEALEVAAAHDEAEREAAKNSGESEEADGDCDAVSPETEAPEPKALRELRKLLTSLERLNALLVDDIAADGNTLEECRAALLAAGAGTVIALSWVYDCETGGERPAA